MPKVRPIAPLVGQVLVSAPGKSERVTTLNDLLFAARTLPEVLGAYKRLLLDLRERIETELAYIEDLESEGY